MKKLALLIAIASCTSPEEATIEAGGKGRVVCTRSDDRGFMYCRDESGAVFVCFHEVNARCISVVRAGEVWR